MRCPAIVPYLAAHAGGDLQPETAAAVETHLAECATCRAESERHARVRGALVVLAREPVEPPPYLAEAIVEAVSRRGGRARRLLPVPLVPPGELVRVIGENRDAIASAAGAAIVAVGAVGAAYALWRTLRAVRPRPAPAR